jgi:hypothetical protein
LNLKKLGKWLLLALAVLVIAFWIPKIHKSIMTSESQALGISSVKSDKKASSKLTEKSFQAALNNASSNLTGNFNLEVYDVSTGKTWTYTKGKGAPWFTASIIKLNILAECLIVQKSDGSNYTGNEKEWVDNMIQYSDDDSATNLLGIVLGSYGDIGTDFTRFGMTNSHDGTSTSGWGYAQVTAPDEMTFIKNIFLPSKVLTKGQQAFMQQEMESVTSDQRWGISKFSPTIKTVALKNGWGISDNVGGMVVNTVGSVTLQNGHEYLIVSLGDGFPDQQTGINNQETVLAAAGKLITSN